MSTSVNSKIRALEEQMQHSSGNRCWPTSCWVSRGTDHVLKVSRRDRGWGGDDAGNEYLRVERTNRREVIAPYIILFHSQYFIQPVRSHLQKEYIAFLEGCACGTPALCIMTKAIVGWVGTNQRDNAID